MKRFIILFLFFSATFFGNFLILYPSHGILVKKIEDGFILPENWEIKNIDTTYHIEDFVVDEMLKYVPNISGEFVYKDNLLISKDGKYYKILDGHFFEVTQIPKLVKKIFIDSPEATATFLINGGFEFSYILKESELYQFLNIFADIDNAFVLVVSEPRNTYRTFSAKLEEKNIEGKKIYQLGQLEGLKNKKHVLLDKINIVRSNYNLIEIGDSSVDWQPTNRLVYIKTPKQIPSGKVSVWEKIFNKFLPLDEIFLPDIDSEAEISLGKSWENWYKWEIKMSLNLGNRKKVIGNLYLKGNGNYRIKIYGKNIDMKTSAKIIKKLEDYVILSVSGPQTVSIEYEKDKK
ncbi:hypothetical protein SU69_02785 [Thermosipho melanesiensis]|uniref:Uncharacterized protein n=2 Tax=Thermosipho melanesiensis TaxID=46541 RepID=A6LKG0_THEM4|nr:hypothetical protein [Thermosipho melanesiensis]ABR30411.1 hypothetical protein Tmel_0544 [Thermosipho melanesiensis BI429]APT73571.1 hypothetical protein BW47_02900 [Thermosipho melanesiensis]OOC37522.1 hypothetical protein SU68_02805 [Thermosipho melanesiensis]OOC39418.1 hypothetical protein SU69_02785 [Thermosipho melanesiensis]OOC39481.1 hypothetical protein SU70_02785 [Thermosipho melanesiensis]